MNKIKAGILRNEVDEDHNLWVKACENYKSKIDYDVIDLTASGWMERLERGKYDVLLAKPSAITARYKRLYDERIYLIDKVLKIPIFPTALEIYIYENKRFFYSWLKANKLPHPRTDVFYNKIEAIDFLKKTTWPLVAKVNIGASGSGIKILNDKREALEYIERAFSSKGIKRRWGPNLSSGKLLSRGFYYVRFPRDIKQKTAKYRAVKADRQKGFVIFQEYIHHDFEWRVVVVGESFFAHKKIKIKDKASGSLLKSYENPPLSLFDLAKEIMDEFKFSSQAIDVFNKPDGRFLINEMQCIFGQSDPHQMLVNGRPGRYFYKKGQWIFENGDFNNNESYDLRLEYVIKKLENS